MHIHITVIQLKTLQFQAKFLCKCELYLQRNRNADIKFSIYEINCKQNR